MALFKTSEAAFANSFQTPLNKMLSADHKSSPVSIVNLFYCEIIDSQMCSLSPGRDREKEGVGDIRVYREREGV